MAELNDDIANLGSTPVSDSAPAGTPVRYEPEFERVESEIAKLQAVNGSAIDWRVVVEDGLTILRAKSKDLLVASFLCRGLFEVHGYPGLGAGLKILREMSESFWNDLFPEAKRPRARAAAANWLAERLSDAIGRTAPSGADRDAIAASLENLEALTATFDAKLEQQAPNFGDLRRALQAHFDSLPAPAAPAETPAETPTETPDGNVAAAPAAAEAAPTPAAAPAPAPEAAPAAAAPAAPGDIATDQDLQKAYRAARDNLRKAAQYLRAKNPASAMPYVLMRQALWLGIDQPPPDKDGVTALREVAADRVAALEALAKAGQHAELIEQLEATLARAPFWLDGQRLAAAALEALGHDAARAAVIGCLAEFLGRFPGLPSLQFANQAPFADDLTRAWIAGEVLSGSAGAEAGSGSGAAAGATAAGEAPWSEAAREAKKLAAKGKIQAAVGLFQAGLRQATSARERFLWALEQARLCHSAGRTDLAVPQLEYLDEEAARFRLEEWEPGLSLEIAALLLSCYKNQSSKEKSTAERASRMAQLQARIVRLDIVSAVGPGQK